ncbi:hypothetical protein D349_01473 [Enterococcus faecalis UP2S-6]|nr:hypothetical protein D349_01473 [Enterococcus faecalis UP2S-6]
MKIQLLSNYWGLFPAGQKNFFLLKVQKKTYTRDRQTLEGFKWIYT